MTAVLPPSPARGFGITTLHILRQAWPVLITQWAGMAFGVLDTAMTGHASAADLAAMSLAVSIYLTIFVGLMGVVHALIPIMAQHFGAGRHADVGRAWGQGIWLALGLSAAGSVLLLFPDLWLALSGDVAPDVRERVGAYLHALVLALPAALMFRTIYALGTAVSRPKVVMAINLGGVGLKALCNWLLIYGKLGLPALGAAGAGVSSAIVYWTSLAVGLWVVGRDPAFRKFALRLGRPIWADLRELLRLGLPMGGSYLVEVCAFTFMALLIAREGTFVSGGHQILANLAALCYMMPMALGVSSASLTAQAIGAGDMGKARETGLAGMALALGGALLTAALLVALRPWIISAYTGDAQVAAVASSLMAVIVAFHVADALQCVNTYLLRAYKIAFVPMLMQVLALGLVGLLGGWWAAFGPGQGTLEGLRQAFAPAAPPGAAAMWIMATVGLALSALLLHAWYWKVVKAAGRAQPILAGSARGNT